MNTTFRETILKIITVALTSVGRDDDLLHMHERVFPVATVVISAADYAAIHQDCSIIETFGLVCALCLRAGKNLGYFIKDDILLKFQHLSSLISEKKIHIRVKQRRTVSSLSCHSCIASSALLLNL